jgi:hypothetical protein
LEPGVRANARSPRRLRGVLVAAGRDSDGLGLAAARIDEAKRVTEAVVATQLAMMQGDGSREHPYIIGAQFSDAELARHKPGYRFADDTTTHETEESHHTTRRRRKTVFRDPLGREAGRSESNDALLAGLTPGQAAPTLWMDTVSNAWRTDDARVIPTSSAKGDRWPSSAGEGNPCMTNGRPGTLVKSEDGTCLECNVVPIQATRSGASLPNVPRSRLDSMSAADAARINDAAYEQYVNELRDAWRPPA